MSKVTDPKLERFLGDERIKTLSDEELCQLVRDFYKLPTPGRPPGPGASDPPDPKPSATIPPASGVVIVNPTVGQQLRDWWRSVRKKGG